MKKTCCNLKRVTLSSFLILILSISFVSAITGSIGNSRMVLRVNQGDIIEKYILVKNVNDVTVEIELVPTGDLADYVKIEEEKFTLEPGTDKKAYFSIKVKKAGTTETNIRVKFNPIDGGNGVGLSSNVIVIAEEKPGFIDSFFDEEIENDITSTNNTKSQALQKINSDKIMIISGLLTTTIFIILLVILLYSFMKRKKIKTKKSAKK